MLSGREIYRLVEPAEITPDKHELAARLGGYCSVAGDGIEGYVSEISGIMTPKYSAVRVPVCYPRSGVVSVGGIDIASAALIKNLDGAREAYLLAVTLGIEVDRYLKRLSVSGGAGHYIADGVASALAEALCDLANGELMRGATLTGRFSPGYGDVPLDIQGAILSLMSARELLGITLTDSNLMIPTKSITAIVGIKNG